jgi:predicted GNAT family acetyltransferase
MTSDVAQFSVVENPEAERFEIHAGARLAGFTAYKRRPGLIAFIHTEVEPAFEGQGVGGRLIAAALDTARGESLAVLPFCPFVRGYIDKHHEYLDLVPTAHREQFDLPSPLNCDAPG